MLSYSWNFYTTLHIFYYLWPKIMSLLDIKPQVEWPWSIPLGIFRFVNDVILKIASVLTINNVPYLYLYFGTWFIFSSGTAFDRLFSFTKKSELRFKWLQKQWSKSIFIAEKVWRFFATRVRQSNFDFLRQFDHFSIMVTPLQLMNGLVSNSCISLGSFV